MDSDLLVQNIKKCCADANLPPTKACQEAGVGKSFISNIKNGQTPSVAKVAELAAYLGVTTSDLVGDARASPAVSELDIAAANLNEAGLKVLIDYAAFLATKDEYKKYAQTDLGKEA